MANNFTYSGTVRSVEQKQGKSKPYWLATVDDHNGNEVKFCLFDGAPQVGQAILLEGKLVDFKGFLNVRIGRVEIDGVLADRERREPPANAAPPPPPERSDGIPETTHFDDDLPF